MMQSDFRFQGMHVAVIMDGNGRWAQARGLPRTSGHRAGAKTVRRVVEAATASEVGTLTLYAFSVDNWHRPVNEVAHLMGLLEQYLVDELGRCLENGVRLNVIGRRDRLRPRLLRRIEQAERATRDGRNLHLRLAVDYSARDALVLAASRADGDVDRDGLSLLVNEAIHSTPPAPDVDLLIRTGGEQRSSDFLLWECAYAEYLFTKRRWPDFTARDLRRALESYRRRERRFGKILDPAEPPAAEERSAAPAAVAQPGPGVAP